MKAIVHVNQHHIKYNRKQDPRNTPTYKPVLTIKMGGKTYYADEVKFTGDSKIIYSRDCPLSCGAEVYLQCDSKDLKLINPVTYKEIVSDFR